MKSFGSVTPPLVFLVLAFCTGARAQGTVNVNNTATTRFLTNAILYGGSSGSTLSAAGPWYFEVMTAPSTVTSVDTSLQQLLGAPWSDTGIEMTNTPLAGRETGGVSGNATANFWPAGQTNSFLVVGWSHGLGSTWAEVAQKLDGAFLYVDAISGGGAWSGGGLGSSSIDYLGATTIGFRMAGGVVTEGTRPTPFLFGSANDLSGNPITTTTPLYLVAPEPSVAALVALALVFAGRSNRSKQSTRRITPKAKETL